MSRAALAEQADTSRSELRRDSVYILYLHNPDLMTDLDDALEGINDLYQQGFFEEFGLSNFPAWQIMQIFMKCKEKGFPLPQVYQGAYNALTRQVEPVNVSRSTFTHLEWGHRPPQTLNSADQTSAPVY